MVHRVLTAWNDNCNIAQLSSGLHLSKERYSGYISRHTSAGIQGEYPSVQMRRAACQRRIDNTTVRSDTRDFGNGEIVTTPKEPSQPKRPTKIGTPKTGTPKTSSVPNKVDASCYAMLLTKDEAGLTGFPATLLPGNRILVRDLPFERLDGICPGEVSVLPPPGSDLPVRRAQPTGTFAHRATENAPTVTAIITLATSVADVRVPEHLTTEKQFEDLISRFDGDLHAGLAAEGMRTALLTEERVVAKAPRKITCTPPQIVVGAKYRWSLCSWLGIFC